MKRFLLPCLAASLLAAPAYAQSSGDVLANIGGEGVAETRMTTEWVVRPAAGMDALLLIGAVGGDVLQAHHYSETIDFLRENLSPEGVAAIYEIDHAFRQERGLLTGPTLALLFSAGPIDTLADVIASAADFETRLVPRIENSPYWSEQRRQFVAEIMPAIHTALTALDEVGYDAWYARTNMPPIEEGIERISASVSVHDVIPEQARLLGRELNPRIEIIVVRFAQPYGIRILGQRSVAFYEWEADTQLRVAAHEIFHPPFDIHDDGMWSLLADLEADPWMASIVEDHDPGFGYNSFQGVINEGTTQALDQIVSERLGFARDPARRWQHADGGMHMFAAAVYQAMKDDGFDRTGGVFSDWLRSALERGLLSPEETRRRAAEIVGQETVDQWGPHRSAE